MSYNDRQIARVAGGLIILGIISGLLSIVPSVEKANFLEEVYPNRNQVYTGALFQFFLVPIYVGFSLLLHSVLRHYDKTLSAGFVGFRFMAAAFQLIGVILLPLFVLLSQEYLESDTMNPALCVSLGKFLRLSRDLTNHLGVILATGLGNLLLYWLLYKEKLVPKWLSLWGFLGNGMILLASILILFQSIEVVSTEYGLLSAPLVIQEIVLAIWLLTRGIQVKGFRE
ncbi:DUF4386 domain-containing protein [bacterium SCSIO 12741]|nr:DUF4386 domain-containing protein [bacterium SCSIO 12741]